MRAVARTPESAPEVLTHPKRPGRREQDRASKKYDKSPTDFEFEFKAYKLPAVKEALNRLFHGKCAYCESRYAGTQPMDVEHWRPKGLVIRNGTQVMKPGYFWLAAEWANLLPSCIDCNRARDQQPPGAKQPRLLGKANQFPIEDETQRWKSRNEPNREIPLLVNPCDDDPTLHFCFTLEGIVQPKLQATGQPSRKGQESIEVYALNRNELVWDRCEVVKQIEKHKSAIRTLARLLDQSSTRLDSADRLTIEDLMSHEMAALRHFRKQSQPFSMMACQLIDEFLQEFTE